MVENRTRERKGAREENKKKGAERGGEEKKPKRVSREQKSAKKKQTQNPLMLRKGRTGEGENREKRKREQESISTPTTHTCHPLMNGWVGLVLGFMSAYVWGAPATWIIV